MNELQIFENSEFGTVRTVQFEGKTYFVANDVAKALGYKRPADAVTAHCKGSVKHRYLTDGGEQELKLIPEGDIYRLVIKSQLPSAEKFESWVFDEVLPSIRKHGVYAVDELLNDPDLAIKAFTALKEEKERNKALQADNDRMRPKEVFADAVATSHTSILIGDLAKLLKQNGVDIGQKRLFSWMRENGYLIKRHGSDWNMPTQRSMELGLFEVKESTVNNPDGSVRINKTTKVTGKGQQYFINKFLGKVA
nr:MAG TPA: repressor domain protein [Caudoviricetes sp.]